jgi:hypothetical protein
MLSSMLPLPVSYFLEKLLCGDDDLAELYGDVGLSSVLKATVLPLFGDLLFLDSLLGLRALDPW